MNIFSRKKSRNTKSTTKGNGEAPSLATEVIRAPVGGAVVPLEQVGDPLFSAGSLGPGAGITPATGEIRAPLAGTLDAVFPTGHAFGIVAEDGTQVLIHVGVDTVEMQGTGFISHVEKGQRVDVGDALVTVDLDVVRAAGYDPVTIVVVLDATDFAAVTPTSAATVESGAPLLSLSR